MHRNDRKKNSPRHGSLNCTIVPVDLCCSCVIWFDDNNHKKIGGHLWQLDLKGMLRLVTDEF